MRQLRTKKCSICRTYRTDNDFIRKKKRWKTCNICSRRQEHKKYCGGEICITAIRRYGFQYDEATHKNGNFSLERDKHNKYDTHAIKVLLDGKQIGFVKATDCATLSPMLDKLTDYKVRKWKVVYYTSGYMIVQLLVY